MDNEKDIKSYLTAINKLYGNGSLFVPKYTDKNIGSVDWVETDITSVSDLIGGGYPRGRVIEIYGQESAGKTTLTLEIIKSFQIGVQDKLCVFIDAEHAFDPIYAQNIGVDVESLAFSQPETAEQILSMILSMLNTNLFSLIVVDSISAMTPRAELDGEVGDKHMALLASLMSQNLRKIVKYAQQSNTTVIFINQLRNKVGVFFGSPEVTSGGNALKFYASVRLDIRKKEVLMSSDQPAGIRSVIKCVKNKVGIPFRSKEIIIDFGKGINRHAEIFETLISLNRLVQRGSSWFLDSKVDYDKDVDSKDESGLNIGNGKANAMNWISENFKEYELGEIKGFKYKKVEK